MNCDSRLDVAQHVDSIKVQIEERSGFMLSSCVRPNGDIFTRGESLEELVEKQGNYAV